MSTQEQVEVTPRPAPPRQTPIRRAALAGPLLAGITVAAWLLVCPWDWRTAAPEPGVYPAAVHPWQWGVIGIVLLALSAGAGAAGHRLLALLCVATPAFGLFCYESAAARGGTQWIVGAVGLLPVLYGAVGVMAVLGHLARRHYAPGR